MGWLADLRSPTFTVEQVAPSWRASGKTGATTSPGVLAGGTNTGAAPTTGAHVVGELVIGHDGKLWVCTAAGTPGTWVQATGGGGGSVEVLGQTVYNPATQQLISATTTSLVDVDATNLAVTFLAPASGKVVVRVAAYVAIGATTNLAWGLRESTTTVAHRNVGYDTADRAHTTEFYVSGLTPGSSHTYKLAHARTSGTNAAQTRYGAAALGEAGAAIITVIAAP